MTDDEIVICFAVDGEPIPQGSMRGYTPKKGTEGKKRRGVRMTAHNAKKLGPWRKSVATAAAQAMGDRPPHDGPVRVALVFRMERPKTVRTELPDTAADLDKLARAMLDGMAKVVYVNDARVVGFDRLDQEWADDESPGVACRVRLLPRRKRS